MVFEKGCYTVGIYIIGGPRSPREGCYIGVSIVTKRGVLHWGVHCHQERGATLGCPWSSREGCYTGVSMVTKRGALHWGVHGHQERGATLGCPWSPREGCYIGVSMVIKRGVLHWGVHGHQERGATLGCPWSPREGCYTGVSMVMFYSGTKEMSVAVWLVFLLVQSVITHCPKDLICIRILLQVNDLTNNKDTSLDHNDLLNRPSFLLCKINNSKYCGCKAGPVLH